MVFQCELFGWILSWLCSQLTLSHCKCESVHRTFIFIVEEIDVSFLTAGYLASSFCLLTFCYCYWFQSFFAWSTKNTNATWGTISIDETKKELCFILDCNDDKIARIKTIKHTLFLHQSHNVQYGLLRLTVRGIKFNTQFCYKYIYWIV